MSKRQRRTTATQAFGVSRREGHDSSAFYSRFPMQAVDSGNDSINQPLCVDQLWRGDAREMDKHGEIADNSVALVVTSPPYFVGKEYEESLGQGLVPASYGEYLEMLHDVFAECVRKLEPGGRIAVNVANLGRKPYRSLSSDVIHILQDRLKLLLRGEVIWKKANGANGNCAWGSYRKPSNPVLRDLTERIVIASKSRFDRALNARHRQQHKHPCLATITADEFAEATTDVWEIPPESATQVGHPAPFPVELPQRLIELYTYENDLVLDPFIGSGTTAVAALRTGRHFIGIDNDAAYVDIAQIRVKGELQRLARKNSGSDEISGKGLSLEQSMTDKPDLRERNSGLEDYQSRSSREGRRARELAKDLLHESGFTKISENIELPCGVTLNLVATDRNGEEWRFDVSGAFSVTLRPGLKRTDTLWKALGKASAIHQSERDHPPLILLTTNLPKKNSAGAKALRAVTGFGKPIHSVIQFSSAHDKQALLHLEDLVTEHATCTSPQLTVAR